MSRLAAIDYLRTPLGAPWEWDEGGNVLVWRDGTTILFREELTLLLNRLAPGGLPPFPALCYLLGACRGKLPQLEPAGDVERAKGPLLVALHERFRQQVTEEFARITRLPPELTARFVGKALLAEAVFERAKRLSVDWSASVVRGLPEAWGEEELNLLPADAPPLDVSATLRLVLDGLRPHTAESLTRRLRTGLDALPQVPEEIELPREERSRRLLDALEADDDHAGLARVVRGLMAALRLPRTLTRPDDTAAEGVSDIGNRGPLDRLVLSELAHDDLTLATRVALNEALYLRREPPVQHPQRSLAVLLDSGLRMWGVPRVLGAASALALISRHPSGCSALAWRADGRHLTPVDLLTKSGFEAHLAALGTELNPAAAIPAFSATVGNEEDVDTVIVTHRDALADASFQARLADAKFDRGFLLVIARDGLVQLHALPWGSPRPLAQVQVDVAQLFPRIKSKAAPAKIISEESLANFPAIFREERFPLLLPVTGKIERSAQIGEGGVGATSDGRLLYWERADQGAQQLTADLPAGQTQWLMLDGKMRVVLVKGRGGDGRASAIISDLSSGATKVARFTGPQRPLAAWLRPGVLLVVLHTRVVTISLDTGEVLAETPIPAAERWLHGCYFLNGGNLTFAFWDGANVRWDSLATSVRVPMKDLLVAFDRDGIGPWIVTREGQVLTPTGTEHMRADFPLASASVRSDGHRIFVCKVGTNSYHELDLRTSRAALSSGQMALESGANVVPPTRNIQARFSSIWAMPGQPLRLRKLSGKKARWLEVFLRPDHELELVGTAAPVSTLDQEARVFSDLVTPRRFGCHLKVARWPGGSVAWLDSRGLLHLRSHKPDLPEITLALCPTGTIAGWTTENVRCGPKFFHGESNSRTALPIRGALKIFCANIC